MVILIKTQHHYLLKTIASLTIENLHAMLFRQSSQRREECQVIILINTEHHYSLKTCLLIRKLTRYVVQTIKSTKRGVSGNHVDNYTAL